MMRLNLDTTTIKFGCRFGRRFLEVLEGSVITSRIAALCLGNRALHYPCVIKGWAIEISNLNWDHCLKLLCMMPKSGVYTWAGSLYGVEVQCNVIWLILLHLALCTYLIDFRDIPRLRRLLDELSSILLTWLFCHQSCRGYQGLLMLLMWINQCAIDFSIA